METVIETETLRLGFTVGDEINIPTILHPLISEVIACYQRHHPDLQSVYLIGSIASGEWRAGISDMDIVGITDAPPSPESESIRRQELVELGEKCSHITFIDNTVVSLQTLYIGSDVMTIGRARLIAISGLNIWGVKRDFRNYLPSIGEMARERAVRAEALMRKYRAGDLIEPFRRDERLLIRSCAKAAMRVLSSIAILRGALFYTSPLETYTTVEQLIPEAIVLGKRTLAIIQGEQSTVLEAMHLTDEALALFKNLCPEHEHSYPLR